MTTPPGFATVTPYMFAEDAEALLAFLTDGLGGELVHVVHRADGCIANAQVRIGSACIMLSEASAHWPAMPASYYLYVGDADASVARAVAAGGRLEMAVADMPYGDRQGGVRDRHGNIWWISQRLVEGPYG